MQQTSTQPAPHKETYRHPKDFAEAQNGTIRTEVAEPEKEKKKRIDTLFAAEAPRARRSGVLPMQLIRELMASGYILGAKEENINPGSLDLTVSDEVYRVDEAFLPRHGESVTSYLKEVNAMRHDIALPLERGTTYLARLSESLALPRGVYAYCNPKSSTGRIDVFVRVVADGVARFDSITSGGFQGALWIFINPLSFPIKLASQETLSQIRFFSEDTRLSELELELAFKRNALVWDREKKPAVYEQMLVRDNDGSVILTLGASGTHVGWECLGLNRILDIGRRDYYNPLDFFRPLVSKGGRVRLKQGCFYILYTRERLRVPPHFAAEIIPMDHRSGEFRSHYAGFIDPGWGYGNSGEGTGRPLVLEVRPIFQDVEFRDGQPVAKICLERMFANPELCYDELDKSNYRKESALPLLSKHFTSPEPLP